MNYDDREDYQQALENPEDYHGQFDEEDDEDEEGYDYDEAAGGYPPGPPAGLASFFSLLGGGGQGEVMDFQQFMNFVMAQQVNIIIVCLGLLSNNMM